MNLFKGIILSLSFLTISLSTPVLASTQHKIVKIKVTPIQLINIFSKKIKKMHYLEVKYFCENNMKYANYFHTKMIKKIEIQANFAKMYKVNIPKINTQNPTRNDCK
jgi:hypothetical protein